MLSSDCRECKSAGDLRRRRFSFFSTVANISWCAGLILSNEWRVDIYFEIAESPTNDGAGLLISQNWGSVEHTEIYTQTNKIDRSRLTTTSLKKKKIGVVMCVTTEIRLVWMRALLQTHCRRFCNRFYHETNAIVTVYRITYSQGV